MSKILWVNKKKEMSLESKLMEIRRKVMDLLNPGWNTAQLVERSNDFWVKDIYEEYVIVETPDSKIQLRIDYSMDSSGELTLSNPVEVEHSWQPKAKDKLIKSYKNKDTVMKDGLPSSAYLVVEDPTKISTWHLPVKTSNGDVDHRLMGAAWAALHGGYRGNTYEGPGKEQAISKLRSLYESEGMSTPSEKGFQVFKQADGNYRWVTISSSAFRDRDGEIVTEKALQEDVQRCNETKDFGPLRWWHLGGWEAPDGVDRWETWKATPGVDIGVCDFNMLHGKMLIESGTFKNAKIGEAFANSQENLEVSIAFSHPKDEPSSDNKEFNHIHRFERSLLPEGQASNLLTKYYVVKGKSDMKAQEKLQALVAIMRNKPEVAAQILTDAETIQKAAETAGLEYKEVEDILKDEDNQEEFTDEEASESETSSETQPETESETDPDPEESSEEEDEAEYNEIGKMSAVELKSFIVDVMKEIIAPQAAKSLSDQAKADQILADVNESLKNIDNRLKTAEEGLKSSKEKLDDLTDLTPVGIKRLQARRATEKQENVVVGEAPTGPRIDESFFKFATKGGS